MKGSSVSCKARDGVFVAQVTTSLFFLGFRMGFERRVSWRGWLIQNRFSRNPIESMYGIFTYIWLIFMVNIGKYISPMDPMGFPRREGMIVPPGGYSKNYTLTRWDQNHLWLLLGGGDCPQTIINWLQPKHWWKQCTFWRFIGFPFIKMNKSFTVPTVSQGFGNP